MEATAVARVTASLEAIEETQPRLNAFTSVLADDALARARELDGQEPVGPLHGLPVVVKDLFDIAGVPTTGCCAAYEGRVATEDSHVVAALRAAGAVVVAKTNQHELGGGATGLVSSGGPVWNPWGEGRIAGGSSSGSAVTMKPSDQSRPLSWRPPSSRRATRAAADATAAAVAPERAVRAD